MFYTNIRSPVNFFLLASDAMSVDWDWTRVVIDHVHIRVHDAAASVVFYKTVLEPLGIPPIWEGEHGAQLANLVVTDGDLFEERTRVVRIFVEGRPVAVEGSQSREPRRTEER